MICDDFVLRAKTGTYLDLRIELSEIVNGANCVLPLLDALRSPDPHLLLDVHMRLEIGEGTAQVTQTRRLLDARSPLKSSMSSPR